MTIEEAKEALKNIPIGSNIELIKTNGDIITVKLATHDISGTEKKDYGDIVVPALPEAITVTGSSRFGQFRIDLNEIVNINRVPS